MSDTECGRSLLVHMVFILRVEESGKCLNIGRRDEFIRLDNQKFYNLIIAYIELTLNRMSIEPD